MVWFGVASYGAAALAFAGLTIVLLASHPGGRRANWITAATGASAVSFAVLTLLLLRPDVLLASVIAIDAVHALIWTACILAWLPSSSEGLRLGVGPLLLIGSGLLAVVGVLGSGGGLPPGSEAAAYAALLGMALIGVLAVEQVFRNADSERGGHLRLLCFGIGAIFVVDLVVYSQATLLGNVIPPVWQARGFANLLVVPLIVFAVKRQTEWERELFVSRHVAFYTASLVGVGAYLLGMSVVAYVLRAVGGEWGLMLQFAFLAVALAVLAVLLFSTTLRARLRVFLVKHFYKNKYDYRHEWLRLTESLGRTNELGPLSSNALRAIAEIIESPHGALWLAREGRYEKVAELGTGRELSDAYEAAHPIVAFLAEQDWVIDSEQYQREPERYGHAFGPPANDVLPPSSIIVPLDCQGHLQGFVVLAKPRAVESLNFEDHDILKTAGSQAAVVLAQAMAQEQLAQTRQFEAVNKLSTFLMHDLKNVIAQQELVVGNAQRFRHRQEFIDDAIETVRVGVERMRKILEQLQAAARSESRSSRADASKVLMEVRSHCADRRPVPELVRTDAAAWVLIDKDKLASCLTHLVRNAQDATPPDGRIELSLSYVGARVSITVKDTGHGMDEAFVRERLFKPFDSTKGTKGMGIGAYQVREAVRAVGGDVLVESVVGAGTTFRLLLPAAGAERSPAEVSAA